MNSHQFCMQILKKKRNELIEHPLTCCYIWHTDISKCDNWLDTYSWKFDEDIPKKMVSKVKNLAT